MDTPLWIWIAFNVGVLLMLTLDLGVVHRHAHAVSLKEAAIWTAVWVALSLAFAGWVWWDKGHAKGLEFITGYVIEYSLSVDNLFVFVVIFSYFAVPAAYQHRVLFWGILAALVMRGAMIGIGVVLITRFAWIMYLFGAFLVYTGIKMFAHKGAEVHPEQNPTVKLCRRLFAMTPGYEGQNFFVRQNGKLLATPLFLVFVVVNVTDLVFATDSIPAIFAITTDPFIVFTSNICAIMGLRSLYFLLAGAMNLFVYLQEGIAVVLTFVGVKMLIVKWVHIPTLGSLGVIAVVFVVAIAASLVAGRAKGRDAAPGKSP
ncbi:MAG: TerC family protein [Verrucomicrobia bacterium]|nr:TerC family protein [Verrucomicrobiota bacterium]